MSDLLARADKLFSESSPAYCLGGISKWRADYQDRESRKYGVRIVHELKITRQHFGDVKSGRKTFEVRKDDRGYYENDFLHLKEWGIVRADGSVNPDYEFTGESIMVEVTCTLRHFHFPEGVPEGYVILGIKVLS